MYRIRNTNEEGWNSSNKREENYTQNVQAAQSASALSLTRSPLWNDTVGEKSVGSILNIILWFLPTTNAQEQHTSLFIFPKDYILLYGFDL